MWWALHRTTYSRNNGPLNSRDYEKTRKEWSLFLKENHHSKRIPFWSEKMSQIVSNDWKNNDRKRLLVGKSFKKSHDDRRENDPEKYYATQKKNSLLGAAAIKNKWETDKEWAAAEV